MSKRTAEDRRRREAYLLAKRHAIAARRALDEAFDLLERFGPGELADLRLRAALEAVAHAGAANLSVTDP